MSTRDESPECHPSPGERTKFSSVDDGSFQLIFHPLITVDNFHYFELPSLEAIRFFMTSFFLFFSPFGFGEFN